MKRVIAVDQPPPGHWVGDGFPVQSLFSYHNRYRELTPFLLLDRAGPTQFEPAAKPRGVGQHPHRGFATVTIVYQGEVAHRDSSGRSGLIGPDEVQWMTAASGIVHQEFHSEAFTRSGGILDMVQLWVNLPAAHKYDEPDYQLIRRTEIPQITLADGASQLRLIAGEYQQQMGPAITRSPIQLWDLRLQPGADITLPASTGWNCALALLAGEIRVNGEVQASALSLVVCSRDGADIRVQTERGATLLLLGGEPIDEPIAGYGPFVMNSREEIEQALTDHRAGRLSM